MQLLNRKIAVLCFFAGCLLYTAILNAAIPTKKIIPLYTLTGTAGMHLSKPSDISVNSRFVYVVDGDNNRIVVYNKKGQYIKQFGRFGHKKGELNYPVGIGLDSEGYIYVADTRNHRIQIFDENGDYDRMIKVNIAGNPVRPVDVVVADDNSKIYVTTKSNKILVYKQNGKKIREIGRTGTDKGEFRFPATITTLSHGRIAAIDILNFRLQIFSDKGKYSYQIGSFGVRAGQLIRPKGVAVAPGGDIYISDSYMDLIQVFTNKGRFLHVLGSEGKPYKMTAPAGIAIDQQKHLYVTEVFANRVSVFQLE